MLFDTKAIGEIVTSATVASLTADSGKIRLGGACRLPVKTVATRTMPDSACATDQRTVAGNHRLG